ncbi:MATE family efflux transporter [Thalassorhabdus alkalitolerans]|uniref:Multidrug export protein MepA n=3 Tax=Bacillaceae TaxID=186817 RepID=A0ABW0YKD1_9BACI
MKKQSDQLGTEPIPKLLRNISVPAMIGMFVMALYNVVDTIFISHGVGLDAVAGVTIAFPVMMIMMAVAAAFGMGGASVISRRLGAQKKDDADKVLGNILFMILLIGAVSFIGAFTIIEPLAQLFGATPEVLSYAVEYLFPILIGSVFFAFGFTANAIIRSEGNSRFAMLTMVIPSILNIILSPIFIFVFNMGVGGAAIATVLSQGIISVIVLWYFLTGRSTLTIKIENLLPQWVIIKEVSVIGFPAFVRQSSGSVMMIAINTMLIRYGGEFYVSVFGIVQRIAMFTLMPMMGILQGMQPIVGYNYGAKQYGRMRETILLSFKVVTVISTFIFVLMIAVPAPFMRVFTSDPATIESGVEAIRIMFAAAFLIGAQVLSGGLYQALGMAKPALVLSMARQILFLIPLVLILPSFLGVYGVWIAFPLADILACALAAIFLWKDRELFFKKKDKDHTMEQEAKA